METSDPIQEEEKSGAELERETKESDDTIIGDHESKAELKNMPEKEPQAQEASADLNTRTKRAKESCCTKTQYENSEADNIIKRKTKNRSSLLKKEGCSVMQANELSLRK